MLKGYYNCYRGVTVCYKAVIDVLYRCYRHGTWVVTGVLKGYYRLVQLVQGCYRGVTEVVQVSCRGNTGVLQGGYLVPSKCPKQSETTGAGWIISF